MRELKYYICHDDSDDNVYYGAFTSYQEAKEAFEKAGDPMSISIEEVRKSYFVKKLIEEAVHAKEYGSKLVCLTPAKIVFDGRWCKYCDNAIDMKDGTWRCTKHTVIDEDLNDEYMQEVEEYDTCELWEECSDE